VEVESEEFSVWTEIAQTFVLSIALL
jgi:hypothetical protein